VFGWHVHEKAALHFVLLLALTAADSYSQNRDFLDISTGQPPSRQKGIPLELGNACTQGSWGPPTGVAASAELVSSLYALCYGGAPCPSLTAVVHYSLFPLLFGAAEYPIKLLMLLLYLGRPGGNVQGCLCNFRGLWEGTWWQRSWQRSMEGTLERLAHVLPFAWLWPSSS